MLLGNEYALVVPVERCLAYLTLIERSANTIKGYAAPQGLVRLGRLDPIAVAIGPRQATGSGSALAQLRREGGHPEPAAGSGGKASA